MLKIIKFFRKIITQFFWIVAPIICFSILFLLSTILTHQLTFKNILFLIFTQPILFTLIGLKIILLFLGMGFFLFFVFSNFSLLNKFFGISLFLSILIFRMVVLYPSVTDNWFIFEQYPKIFDDISKSFSASQSKKIIDWLPFVFILIVLTINMILYSQKITHKNSEKYFKQANFWLLSFCVGSVFVFSLVPNLSLKLPKNTITQEKPHVFMFVIDSFRFDRLTDKKYKDVMPFLSQYAQKADIFLPMLASHSNTFKSWEDITTGQLNFGEYAQENKKSYRQKSSLDYPLFKTMKENGYKTLFVSDFLSVKNITEKKVISKFPILLSILILPKWQRLSPSFFEIPLPENPRIIGRTFANVLTNHSYQNRPLFITTFFSLDTLGFEEYTANHIQKIYDQSLQSIDQTLQNLFFELNQKNWDKKSIILVFGTHGQSLYDQTTRSELNLKLGNETEFLTPFILSRCPTKSDNDTEPKSNDVTELKLRSQNKQLMRTIDIAPIIVQNGFDKSKIGLKNHYIETFDEGLKERAWLNDEFKLIVKTTHSGSQLSLFERLDLFSEHNLLENKSSSFLQIAQYMLNQMSQFLNANNVEYLNTQADNFYFSENFEL